MKRLPQLLLITTFLGFSWLAMQATHELGHVLAAYLTGGQVLKVVLWPLAFSRTDLTANPHPLAVVWSGPLVGIFLPILSYGIACALRLPGKYLFRWFAGFCLIANGAYIGAGYWASDHADPWVMTTNGSPIWLLVLFGALTVPPGLFLWHRQGPYFGFGPSAGKVNKWAVAVSVCLFVAITAAELWFGSR